MKIDNDQKTSATFTASTAGFILAWSVASKTVYDESEVRGLLKPLGIDKIRTVKGKDIINPLVKRGKAVDEERRVVIHGQNILLLAGASGEKGKGIHVGKVSQWLPQVTVSISHDDPVVVAAVSSYINEINEKLSSRNGWVAGSWLRSKLATSIWTCLPVLDILPGCHPEGIPFLPASCAEGEMWQAFQAIGQWLESKDAGKLGVTSWGSGLQETAKTSFRRRFEQIKASSSGRTVIEKALKSLQSDVSIYAEAFELKLEGFNKELDNELQSLETRMAKRSISRKAEKGKAILEALYNKWLKAQTCGIKFENFCLLLDVTDVERQYIESQPTELEELSDTINKLADEGVEAVKESIKDDVIKDIRGGLSKASRTSEAVEVGLPNGVGTLNIVHQAKGEGKGYTLTHIVDDGDVARFQGRSRNKVMAEVIDHLKAW